MSGYTVHPAEPQKGRRTQQTIGTSLHMIAAGLGTGDSALADMEILMWADTHAAKAPNPEVARQNLLCTIVHLAAGMMADAAISRERDPMEMVGSLRARASSMLEGAETP